MSERPDINGRVESLPFAVDLGSGVAALVAEIASLVERLAGGGEPGAIDLRSLPMTTADRARLCGFLGTGEVRITIDAEGLSTVRETATPGVWWTEHRNRDGELLAELIEVCRVPDIVVVAREELAAAGCRLRERIAALDAVPL